MPLINTLTHCDFHFPGQLSHYNGKVREVYELENDLLVMVASDRLSAFDVVMPKGIPLQRSNPQPDCCQNDGCYR